jgi:hypothetical protein
MGSAQSAHLPRNTSQLTTGMLRYHFISALHLGQCDGGETTLSPRGMRHMQTLRKLAMQAPIPKAKQANTVK